MNFFKTGIFKFILIVLLIMGGGIFIISIPKFFPILVAKIIDSIPREPNFDEDGKPIYRDWRKTKTSFGKRNQFAIEKSGTEEIIWALFDRDNNKEIDIVFRYIMSPSKLEVYTIGEKGYTKVDTNTSEIIQNKNIDEFSQYDQEIFRSLEAGKGFIKKQLCDIIFLQKTAKESSSSRNIKEWVAYFRTVI